MEMSNANVRNFFVMFFAGVLMVLSSLGFPSLLIGVGLLTVYCYGFYWAISKRQVIGEFLQLVIWLFVPCVKEKEGEESPPASPSGLNPLNPTIKMKMRSVLLEQNCHCDKGF